MFHPIHRVRISPVWILALLSLLAVPDAQAQLIPFGFQEETVTQVTCERRDWDGGPALPLIFAATAAGAIHANDAFGNATTWKEIGRADRGINALGVQHWGVGPFDGLHLFAAPARTIPSKDRPLLLRNDVRVLSPLDTMWVPADSGMDRTLIRELFAVDAAYYTGHTPPQPVLAGGAHGAWKSGAGGMFWEAATGTDAFSDITAIDIAPHWFGTHAWAAGSSMLSPAAFRSTDMGATWERRLLVMLPIEGRAEDVVINPRFPDSVYVVAAGSVFLTPDGGVTWDTVSAREPGASFHHIILDPLAPEHVYLAGWEAAFPSVLRFVHSSDGGATWRDAYMPGGIQVGGATDLAFIDTEDAGAPPQQLRAILISTMGTGVWMYRVPAATSAGSPPGPTAPELSIAPQPVHSQAHIAIRVDDGSSRVELAVMDALGRTVLARSFAPASGRMFRHDFDAASLPAGVYVASVRAGTSQASRRFIVVH